MITIPRARLVVMLLGLTPAAGLALDRAEAKAISVLASRFEAVAFVTGAQAAKDLVPGGVTAADAVRVIAYEGRVAMDVLGAGIGKTLAVNSTSVLVGARDFRAPRGQTGLGAVQSTRCVVYALRQGSAVDPARGATGASRLPGTPAVWTWKAPKQEGSPSAPYFAASLDKSYFVLANDLAELRRVLALLADGGEVVPDIVAASRLAGEEMWAYRRFRRAGVSDPVAAGLDIAPGADALVVIPADPTKGFVVRLLGKPGDTSAVRRLNEEGHLGRFVEREPGVWESSIAARRPREEERLFVVLGILGFGIYL